MILNYSGWGVQCIGFIARFITIVTHSLGNVLSNVIVYISVLPLLFLLILLPLFSQRSTASSTVLVNASGKLSYNLSHCLSARICPSISYTESISMVCLPAKGNEGCYLVNDGKDTRRSDQVPHCKRKNKTPSMLHKIKL